MDRAEQAGLGLSIAGHGALLVLLTLAAAATRLPIPRSAPIEVSFVDDVGLVSAAPAPSVAPPAPSLAPELGTPRDSDPQPSDTLVPRAPAPSSAPAPAPAEAPSRPPAPKPKALPKAAAPRLPAEASPARGSRLGADFLKGLGREPSTSRSQAAPAAAMSAEALASIKSVIERQIQPCADRQRDPGPGANQIRVTLNLRLNPDGSLARDPEVVRTTGVTEQNSRYESRVRDLAVAAYVGCSPLRGLPAELFRTPSGGWSNLNMTYRLP